MPKMPLNIEYSHHAGGMRQRIVNMYAEKTPNGPEKFTLYPRQGLQVRETIGDGPIRSRITWQDHSMTVSGGSVFANEVNIGSIPGDDLCRRASSEDYLVVVSEGKAYNVTLTSVTQITDVDLFTNVVDVLYLSGRFVYFDGDSSQFQWSAVGDPTAIDGLDFATADENESSQKCIGAMVLVDDMVIFMNGATEWWASVSDVDAPFQRSPGRRYNKGILSRPTTVFLDNTIFFVGSDKQVYRASSVPQRVSNFDIESLIEQVLDNQVDNITAFGATFAGHVFFVMFLPGVGTWALDVSSGKWDEWSSWGEDRFRIQVADGVFLGDYENGNIYKFAVDTYYDNTDPIEKIVSSYLPVAASHYPIDTLYLKCPRGVGVISGQGSVPVVEMRFSDEEGSKFSNWQNAPLGGIGDTSDSAKAVWSFLGSARAPGRLFEFRCSDPVFFAPSAVLVNEILP